MHIYLAKSSRFESTDFASVMIDDVGCSRRHQCPQCDGWSIHVWEQCQDGGGGGGGGGGNK